ncbi:MAG: VWA domain-containing protein [Gemmataceae bacterium]
MSDLYYRLGHFLSHPLLLTALLALPLLAVLAWRATRRRRRVFAQFGHWPSVQSLVTSPRRFRWLRFACFAWALMALGIASAGPQWSRDLSQSTAPGRDLVVVLDSSRSMLAEQPTRFSHAQAVLLELVNSLRQRGGNRIALVAFAGQAKVLCPLTHDYDHFKETLDNLDAEQLAAELRPVGDTASGTRIGIGLLEAIGLHEPRYQGSQDILLVSDGDDPVPDSEWLLAVKVASAHGVPVHTVGVGDPNAASPVPGVTDMDGRPIESRLVEKPLQEIAQRTGGFYEAARTHVTTLGKRYRDEVKTRSVREASEDTLPIYQQRANWFFIGALGLLTMETALAALPRIKTKRFGPITSG